MPREELPEPIRRHQLLVNYALHWKVVWRKLKFQKGVGFMWSIINIEGAVKEWWRKIIIYRTRVIQIIYTCCRLDTKSVAHMFFECTLG